MSQKGWFGVDLDGTLAEYWGWLGEAHIGEPVPAMLERVKQWTAEGIEVRIFTARVQEASALPHIEAWLTKHGIGGLKVTNVKDYGMVRLYDDRCVQVEANTGRLIGEGA